MKTLTLRLANGEAALVIEETQTHTITELLPLNEEGIKRASVLLQIARNYIKADQEAQK